MEHFVEESTADLGEWVEGASSDPVSYRRRQVAHILLRAIAMTPNLKEKLYLKGGILMALAYKSLRSTSDIDFSSKADPESFSDELTSSLDRALLRAAAELGYPLSCRIQATKKDPRLFEAADAPSLAISIASAARGTNEVKRLERRQASQVLWMEVSFKEPVESTQQLAVGNAGTTIKAYARTDLIAEKLRALLQQPIRNRNRRQDVFDIAYLIDRDPPSGEDLSEILRILCIKSEARHLDPNRNSMRDPEVYRRSKAEWETLQAELSEPLPPFDETFDRVLTFYESLPWTRS